jgi:hypothetical protein
MFTLSTSPLRNFSSSRLAGLRGPRARGNAVSLLTTSTLNSPPNRSSHVKPNPFPHLKPKRTYTEINSSRSSNDATAKTETPPKVPETDNDYRTKVAVKSAFTVGGFCVAGPFGGILGYMVSEMICMK